MSKKRFKLSQIAHNRLMRSHRSKAEVAYKNKQWSKYNNHFIKSNYHSLVAVRQEKLDRLLTPNEKKISYRHTVSTFY